MKNFIQIFLLIASIPIFSQNHWSLMEDEQKITVEIDKSIEFELESYTFNAVYEQNIPEATEDNGSKAVIKSLSITKGGKMINTLYNITDYNELGTFIFSLYDYNLDGYLDFSIQRDCRKVCYYNYYLFDTETESFKHEKSWNYLRIQKIEKKKKLILSQPDGTATDGWQILYQIQGKELIEVEKSVYGNYFDLN